MLNDKRGLVVIKNEEISVEMDGIVVFRFFFKRRPEYQPQLEHYLDLYNILHLPTLFNLENWANKRNLSYHFDIRGSWWNARFRLYKMYHYYYSAFGQFLPIKKK